MYKIPIHFCRDFRFINLKARYVIDVVVLFLQLTKTR